MHCTKILLCWLSISDLSIRSSESSIWSLMVSIAYYGRMLLNVLHLIVLSLCNGVSQVLLILIINDRSMDLRRQVVMIMLNFLFSSDTLFLLRQYFLLKLDVVLIKML